MSGILEIFRRPAFLPSLAALLIAAGIESDNLYLHHSLEILGSILAFIGLFITPPRHE